MFENYVFTFHNELIVFYKLFVTENFTLKCTNEGRIRTHFLST